ncbi:MAG: TonB-dependent receptor domain-containing protein [Thermoanaerobaculia bacterium]
MRCRVPLLIVMLISIAPSVARAQVTAVLQGRLFSGPDTPIAGATVQARNTDTGFSRSATTDGAGSYRIPALPVGPYEVTASAPNFSSEVRSGITLRVGQEAKLDFTLVGAAREAITVTSEAPIIETTKTDIGTTITTEQIDDLPLITRSFTELAGLTPGIQDSVTENGGISANGGSGSSNTFLIDGVSNDRESLGGERSLFSPDVIAEFEVISSQYSAEFGRASGAVINVVTRSGTNQVRGRLSAYYQSDELAEEDPFFAEEGEAANFNQEIFSGFLGGPFVRDKAFFFLAYERTRAEEDLLISVSPELLAAHGQDPQRTVPQATDIDRYFARFDLNLSSQQILTARYDRDDFIVGNVNVGGNVTVEAGLSQPILQQNAVLAHSWVPSEKIVNDLRFQWALSEVGVIPNILDGRPYIIRPNITYGQFPSFQQFDEERFQIVETLGLQVGENHFVKGGFDVSEIEVPLFVTQIDNGLFFFTTDAPFNAADRSTYPLLFQQGIGDPNFLIEDRIYGVFLQDEWRVTPHFTLNLGLRWDYEDHSAIEDDTDNLGPRLHFAWDPLRDGKTVVRGGYGIYHDAIFLNVPLISEFLAPGRFMFTTILFPGFPDPRVGGMQLPPGLPDIAVLAEGNETPNTEIASLGFSREIARDLAVSLDAVYAEGNDLLIPIDLNAPVGGVRPDPNFGEKFAVSTLGRSEYKALELGLRKRFGGRYSLNVAYTLSENKNNTDTHRGAVSDPKTEFGSSDNDVRHTLNAAANINGPWGLKFGLSGGYRSGPPYTIITGVDTNGDGNFNFRDRPPGVDRNSERAPEAWAIAARLAKAFKIGPVELELIGEAFNITNEENGGCVSGVQTDEDFGKPTCSRAGVFGPRKIRVGVRIDFN